MQNLEVSGAVQPLWGSLGFKGLTLILSNATVLYKDLENCDL